MPSIKLFYEISYPHTNARTEDTHTYTRIYEQLIALSVNELNFILVYVQQTTRLVWLVDPFYFNISVEHKIKLHAFFLDEIKREQEI